MHLQLAGLLLPDRQPQPVDEAQLAALRHGAQVRAAAAGALDVQAAAPRRGRLQTSPRLTSGFRLQHPWAPGFVTTVRQAMCSVRAGRLMAI